uniref:Uncharacterized protein n=1 Tax=Salix viminalis TaxID=40686 RepID=A0A6N2MZ62_SALVM
MVSFPRSNFRVYYNLKRGFVTPRIWDPDLLISLYYTWITFDEGKTKRMIWKLTLGTIYELENLNASMSACVCTARLIICQAGQYF